MDELAYALAIDPLRLRVINHAAEHPTKHVPFSAKYLEGLLYPRRGTIRLVRARSDAAIHARRRSAGRLGHGDCDLSRPTAMKAAVRVRLRADGTATVQCASHDIGTGAYTAFTQIASEQLGLPFENVTFELGDSELPFGPVAGGSNSTATVGTAIHAGAQLMHRTLATLAVAQPESPLHGAAANDIVMVAPGRIGSKIESAPNSDGYADILKRGGRDSITVETRHARSAKRTKRRGISLVRCAFLRSEDRSAAAARARQRASSA